MDVSIQRREERSEFSAVGGYRSDLSEERQLGALQLSLPRFHVLLVSRGWCGSSGTAGARERGGAAGEGREPACVLNLASRSLFLGVLV